MMDRVVSTTARRRNRGSSAGIFIRTKRKFEEYESAWKAILKGNNQTKVAGLAYFATIKGLIKEFHYNSPR